MACLGSGTANASGWSDLLLEAGITSVATTNIRQISISVDPPPEHLDNFFAHIFDRLKLDLERREPDAMHTRFILLNLTPLNLCTTLIDKIITGILFSNAANPIPADCHLIFLLRNIDHLLKSNAFGSARASGAFGISVSTVDFRGYAATVVSGTPDPVVSFGRRAFATILPTEPHKVHRSLVFETNTHLGHFMLPNSHVRTHYDLTEFIARDNVWEFILGILSEIVGDHFPILVVGTGLEESAIRTMAEQFQSAVAERIVTEFHYLPDPSTVLAALSNWSERFNIALVLGDIVNSGTTLHGVVSLLKQSNFHARPIRVFAVARMQNSPRSIEDVPLTVAVGIPRDYYSAKASECLLCELAQPAVAVNSARDFTRIDEAQLTPFDFWEIVPDSSALRQGATDPQQRHFLFRVDTEKLVKRYGRWLENVIRYKAQQLWPNIRPDLLCTVREESGIAFAHLVSKALSCSYIVSIPRTSLRRVTPASKPMSELTELAHHHEKRLLLVDDGINYGHTLRTLITACRVANATIMGAIVLDCRLNQHGVGTLCHLMGSTPLLSLYTWPSATGAL